MINSSRVQRLSSVEYKGGTVIYQMCRDIRVQDNDALLFAQELAEKHNAKLIVTYVIWNYMWVGATRRFYDVVIPSLQEVEKELRKYNIPLMVVFKDRETAPSIVPEDIGAVVIDQLPLHFMDTWKNTFLSKNKKVPLYEVDAHNCIPVWETSSKQEFAARTIRSKIHQKLPLFLEEYEKLSLHTLNENLLETILPIDWSTITSKIICDEKVKGVGTYTLSVAAGHNVLSTFLTSKLAHYDTSRNEITEDGQSNLSPYIAHGIISRRRIILELSKHAKVTIQEAFDAVQNGSNGKLGSIAAFIEECVVRAELCENFCYYNKKYDKVTGFPLWAQETLTKASTDTRQYVYDLETFEQARTHDELWNAAQMQMIQTGKMHGYMRMYWAKKILEWSVTPKDALKTSIYLNDTYELDGRDPNGYVGCAWSIGGVHDRPWFPRPVFGTVRFMARSGVEKRGDASLYISKWTNRNETLF